MPSETQVNALASLDYCPYVDTEGMLPISLSGKIGAYAIFSADQTLQYVGYSRDILVSLKQHLIRQPRLCYWLKTQVVEKPNRTLLESIRKDWIADNGAEPQGNGPDKNLWEQAIDVKAAMTPDELTQYNNPELDEIAQVKVLKQAARRIEAEILDVLAERGVQEPLRFNPKLKETGLLDLK
ncbi:MAG: GIY-YIG nuclease family protein [Thermosynechococcaceae cyanobacterium]